MRSNLIFGLGLALVFGVLVAGAIKGPVWRQVAFGALAAVVAFFSLLVGAMAYDRWVAGGSEKARSREPDDEPL
jgi:hypothetical protein